jgi:hypothetical protein
MLKENPPKDDKRIRMDKGQRQKIRTRKKKDKDKKDDKGDGTRIKRRREQG